MGEDEVLLNSYNFLKITRIDAGGKGYFLNEL